MSFHRFITCCFFLFSTVFLQAEGIQAYALSMGCDTWEKIERDIKTAQYWYDYDFYRLNTYYNYYLNTGYFVMPSARQDIAGMMGGGFSQVKPYNVYALQIQPFNRLQASGIYRVFKGVEDLILSRYGFGDYMDRGINIKFSFLLPEDTDCLLPGLAYGMEDVWGTHWFHAQYIVGTQVIKPLNVELTLGWGRGRIQGFFGGGIWTPFRKSGLWFLKDIALCGEIDATNYHDSETEPHPDGREQKSNLNYGVKYKLFNFLDAQVSSLRGTEVAWSVALNYNFGEETGLLPKIKDPSSLKIPKNYEPLGLIRTDTRFAHELAYTLKKQGFDLLYAWISKDNQERKTLRLTLINMKFLFERKARVELQNILSRLVPSDVDSIVVVVSSKGLLTQQYTYRREDLLRYADKKMGVEEMLILSSPHEVKYISSRHFREIYAHKQDWWQIEIMPYAQNFFGNKHGKIKTVLGLLGGLEGYLFNQLYYQFQANYIPYSDIRNMADYDTLNPSTLLNVESDIVRYYQINEINFPQLYVQKSFNMTHGWFSRLSAGWYQINFGGFAGEFLYYPVSSHWGFGVEGAMIKKRNTTGFGFTNKIRYFDAKTPVWESYDWLYQYALNLYFDIDYLKLNIETNIGQFLAKDQGFRFNFTRYFNSGLKINCWIAFTNGKDIVNGRRFFNSGVGFSMPLDVFLHYHSRLRWGYSLTPWLRDSGVMSSTGKSLYEILTKEREK